MAVRLPVDPSENLDQIIARLKNYPSQDVVLVLPPDTRVLQELNNFYTLRSAVRAENINLSIAGGNKTIRGLANLLGFSIEKENAAPARPGSGTGNPPPNQGTVFRPNYSGVPDGFVASSPPPPSFKPNLPDQPPVSSRPAPPQNFTGGQPDSRNPLPDIFNNPGDSSAGRQPLPRPGFNLGGSGEANRNNAVSYEEASRKGFFNTNELGKLGATYQPAGLEDEDTPIVDFEDETDNAAGQFRTSRGGRNQGSRPNNGGIFGGRRSNRDVQGLDEVEIEEVEDPDGMVAEPVASSNSTKARVKRLPVPGSPAPNGRTRMAAAGPVPKGQAQSQDSRQRLILILGVLFAVLLVILLLLLLVKPGGVMNLGPSVQTLTVPLKTETQTATVRLALVPGGSTATSPTQATATVPAGTVGTALPGTPGATATATPPPPATLPVEMVNTGEIKKTGEHAATGSRKVPDKPASGPAVFYNRSFNAISYGAGAVIYTRNGVTYRLVRAITINGSATFNGQAGQATGEVVADKAGTVGNIAEVASFPLNGNVGVGLGPLTNGTDKDEKFITQADQDDLKKQLRDQALSEVNNALKYDQTTQGVLVIKTSEPVCEFPKKVNEVTETFNGSCTTSLEAAKYRTDDVTKGAATHMVTDPAYRLDDKTSLEFVGAPKLVEDGGQRFMEIQVRGRVIRNLDTEAFKTAIAGKTKAAASVLIASDFPEVDLSQLDLKGLTGDTLPAANLLEVKTVLDYEAAAQATLTTTPGDTSSTVPVGSPPAATPKS